jgi:hypothetical protein
MTGKEGHGTAYLGKFFCLMYAPRHSLIDGVCDGVKLKIYHNSDCYWSRNEWSVDVKFKNFIFDTSTPFEERLKRAITAGTERVMELDEIKTKEAECDKKCSIKIDKSVKGVLNGN